MADAAPRQSDDTLVGRDRELHAVERGLGETGVLIEGDPGIGKTVLWEEGLALAETAGGRVLRARATPPERRLALTVIEDLLSGEVAEILPSMAPPQRRALRAALLEVDTAVAPDARAISLAFLEALRLLARRGRLVLGVDDVQWLDPASARTLAYALRRLPKDEAVVLATRRTGEEVDASAGLLLRVMDERGIERVGLPPLDESGVATLLRRRLNARLSRPARHRIFELSAGNPLFALELARADKPEPWPSLATSDLPDRLAWAIGTRLRTLPMAVREILAAAALSTAATVDQLTFVLEKTSNAVRDAVGVADGAGIAGLSSSSSVGDDVVAFRHPLFRSAAAELVPPATARTLHARFALAVPDDEEIARHLAAASTTPEAHVADVLHAAARRAASRGALDASAELDLLASRLTPDDQAEERARRAVTAAISLHAAGDRPKAEELLSSRIDGFPPGASRAKAFTALAIMAWNELHRAAELLDRAEREAGDDPWIRSRVLATAAWVEAYGGSLARAAQLSDEAIDLGRRGDDPGLRGALAVRSWVALLRCEDEPADVDLTSSTASGYLRGDHCSPKLCHAMGRRWVGDLPAARALLTEDDDAMAADGAEVGRIEPLAPLAEVLWRLGEWDATASLLEQLGDIGVDAGVPQSRQAQWTHVTALLATGRGAVEEGLAVARRGAAAAGSVGDRFSEAHNHAALVLGHLVAGDASAAIVSFERARRLLRELGVHEVGVLGVMGDGIEALATAGDRDELAGVVADLEAASLGAARPWAAADAARGRALLLEGEDAETEMAKAADAYVELAMPLEAARCELWLGTWLRRRRQQRRAREALVHAKEAFERLGAAPWEARAASELSRIGGRPAAPTELTEAERQVALLVAEGLTNADIAARLHLSTRTVEAHLSHAYVKFGVRSRAALVAKVQLG